MTQHEKDRQDRLELPWIVILSAIVGLFAWGYVTLDNSKLDKAVFDEHNRSVTQMASDIREIRNLMAQQAARGRTQP